MHGRSRQSYGIALCLASALSFSTLPFLANGAYRAGMGLTELLLVRFLVAGAALWLIVALRRSCLPPPRLIATGLALGAVGYATQSALYFAALPYNGPSLTTLLLYTFPVVVFVVLLARGKERATRTRLIALALALAGVAVVLLGTGSGTLHPVGIALGLGTALAYALYILIGDSVDAALDRITLSALVCTGAAATYTAVTIASGGPSLHFRPSGWWWAGALGLVATAFALTAFFAGMRLVGAASASIISCVEPVATVLIGVSLFNERLGPIQLLGALAVVTAVVLLQWRSPARAGQIGGQGSAGHSPEGSG
ncbi:MAG: DMT family transporter [Actinomycetota bacterium]|nr:DMT family transporter [Actinomycetota bacterium]